MAADPYATLGVSRGAEEKDIKSAYRKLAKELHPDRNKDNPKAAERFSDVTKAYDLLSDKDKRARFDRGEIDADGNPAMPFGGGFRGVGERDLEAVTHVGAARRSRRSVSACPTGRPSTSSCPPGSRTARKCGSRAKASPVPAALATGW